MSSGNDSGQEDEMERKDGSFYTMNSSESYSSQRRHVMSTQPNVYTPLSLTSRCTESQQNTSSNVVANDKDIVLLSASNANNKFNGGNSKSNNSSRCATVKNQRSSVRPFFCCGSELSLVSLVEGIDLKDDAHSHNRKLQSIECYSSSDDEAFELSPLRRRCNSVNAGDMSRHTTLRRKKKEKHVKKKKFWSLRLHSRWSPRWRSRRSQRSKCSRDFSQQSIASGCSSSCNAVGPSVFSGQSPNVRSISTATSQNQFLGFFNFLPAEDIAEVARQRRNEEVALGIELHAQAISRAFRSNVDVSGSMMDILRFRSRLSSTNSDILHSSDSPIEDILMNNLFTQVQNSRGSVDSWRGPCPQVHTQIDYAHFLVPDLAKITSCSYYWGVMDRYEAERLLENKPPGTFLLRDSAQEDFLFSVSFRRYNRSLHARIEQWNHRFSFDAHDPNVFSASTVCELVEHYKDPSLCMFFEPMLTRPLHRTFPFSLQHMSRTVICDRIAYDDIQTLPIPNSFKKFLQMYHYKKKIRVRRFDIPEMAAADSRVVP